MYDALITNGHQLMLFHYEELSYGKYLKFPSDKYEQSKHSTFRLRILI